MRKALKRRYGHTRRYERTRGVLPAVVKQLRWLSAFGPFPDRGEASLLVDRGLARRWYGHNGAMYEITPKGIALLNRFKGKRTTADLRGFE